jgi:DDE_Tnp_1-associated/Transposase DDE domain
MESNIKATPTNASEQSDAKIISMGNLLSYLLRVKDGRKRRGIRYSLATVLTLLILAKLCGQNKVYGIADWAQQRSGYLVEALRLKHTRLPHHSTYRRILTDEVDGDELEQIVAEYMGQLPRSGQDIVIAIDGKTVRGTISLDDPFGLHLLATYLPGEGIVLMQMVVEKDKENEIVVAPKLLQCLDLRNKVVIGDAMHTQRQISIQIIAADDDFVWIVKDNQANTRQAIEQLFAPEQSRPGFGCPPMDFGSAKTIEKQAGRLEECKITVSKLLNDYLVWPHRPRQLAKSESIPTTTAAQIKAVLFKPFAKSAPIPSERAICCFPAGSNKLRPTTAARGKAIRTVWVGMLYKADDL